MRTFAAERTTIPLFLPFSDDEAAGVEHRLHPLLADGAQRVVRQVFFRLCDSLTSDIQARYTNSCKKLRISVGTFQIGAGILCFQRETQGARQYREDCDEATPHRAATARKRGCPLPMPENKLKCRAGQRTAVERSFKRIVAYYAIPASDGVPTRYRTALNLSMAYLQSPSHLHAQPAAGVLQAE